MEDKMKVVMYDDSVWTTWDEKKEIPIMPGFCLAQVILAPWDRNKTIFMPVRRWKEIRYAQNLSSPEEVFKLLGKAWLGDIIDRW